MGKFSKAIAGGVGSALSTMVVAVVNHFVPNLTPEQQQAMAFLIYTAITSFTVYQAPANTK